MISNNQQLPIKRYSNWCVLIFKLHTVELNNFIFYFFFMLLRSVSNIVYSSTFTVCINNDQNVVSFISAHGHEE